MLGFGLAVGGGVGVSAATVHPAHPAHPAHPVHPEAPTQEDASPASAEILERAPDPVAAEDPTYTLYLNYVDAHAAVIIAAQSISGLPQGAVITETDLLIPTGYRLEEPFTDFPVSRDTTLNLKVQRIPIPTPEYEITVRYLLTGEEVGGEMLGPLPEGFVVHDADLTIPAGYVQANPMAPHVVVGTATLDIPVLRDTVPVVDVRVWFHHGTDRVGLQDYPGTPVGAVITEATLVIPRGYLLAEPFADYTVTEATELVVQVVPDPDAPVTPEPPVSPPPTEPPPVQPQPPAETPPPVGGTPPPHGAQLARTGSPGGGSLLAGVLGFVGVAGGAALVMARRRQGDGS